MSWQRDCLFLEPTGNTGVFLCFFFVFWLLDYGYARLHSFISRHGVFLYHYEVGDSMLSLVIHPIMFITIIITPRLPIFLPVFCQPV